MFILTTPTRQPANRWLEESGFITGMPVTVTVERGRIIIETQINL
ncbi:SymE family type I addiction module toxin [Pectobacterium cacticida]